MSSLPGGGTLQNNQFPSLLGPGATLLTFPGGGKLEPAIVQGLQSGAILNNSGVGHNVAKLLAGVNFNYEDDGNYKEEWSPDIGQTVRRGMIGPWSQLIPFASYCMGYAVNKTDPDNPAAGVLSRVIPVQHPKYPWLYCTSLELVQGVGAWLYDANCPVADGAGNPILGGAILDAGGNVVVDPNTGEPLATAVAPAIPFVFYAAGQGGTFTDGAARVVLTYRALPYEVRTDEEVAALGDGSGELSRYVHREETYAVQAQPIPATAQFTITDPQAPPGIAGTQFPGNPTIIQPTAELVYTWHSVPDRPIQAYLNCVGRVNSNPFDSPSWGGVMTYPPGTLLCMAWRTERRRAVNGRIVFDIVYKFGYKFQTWNAFPNAKDLNYYVATTNFGGQNQTLYKYADFSQLFQMPAPVKYQGPLG